jgi:protein transport protein SEC61 subunit gamma and related proteins
MNKEIEGAVEGVKDFYGASRRFLDVCEKPDMAGTYFFDIEFKKIATSCAIGFAIMGGIGYVVKLLFIPINNIILS